MPLALIMDGEGRDYYINRESEILASFDGHARSWRPFLVERYSEVFTEAVTGEAREQLREIIFCANLRNLWIVIPPTPSRS
ncbi:MAG: hypothetical protein ACUVWR_19535 [Anaerolineae bacterium]